ncbi:twin-arginine translocase TatA/TatE family subunit [[Pasteurella] aerogenes]|nr:twin-arginine translocase TatA/TatE family subunit [[Pasteurella] aerogenes]MCI7718193.1 twin-arginine translocase TatA/TatE family subunit [[Pasteurella] aerogenes]MCU9998143.1 twin-arginine translocase TatA/TatE family subunit [[Pasteurella] aerogenes]MDY2797382.1 twin-arginine translocase TatA/TatE family subunit [[Pasteurella] aerogenes]MDY4479754.1 twin-arginine translocase TatA/TatE family subunit [[Pasteurella] aerogenes]
MGFSWQQLLILLLVIIVIFGTKKLRNVGSDLGAAVKGFKKAMNEDEPNATKDAEFKKITDEAAQTTQSDKVKDKEQA